MNIKIITATCVVLFSCASLMAKANKDNINNGVHGYTPKNYVHVKDPLLKERLEWFKDQKLALMMHWGVYSVAGLVESWALSDSDSKWSRKEVTWTKDSDRFKREYFGLSKSFNPIRFNPKTWAQIAKDCGFKYLIFTTKHHDGFCLFDSKYSDYKVTSPECPFSTNPQANIVKHVFDAFREQGLSIAAYFSKPDWHNSDYWEDFGIGRKTSRMPTYDVRKNPNKWARFREYVKNQILELVRDYGKIDIIWLDGGQVQRRCGLDINIEDIIAEARKYNPALISVDRVAGGTCENVITPEQTIPKRPIAVPWESCITIGKSWGYHYDDVYKTPYQIIRMMIDIVAKGGNLALNVGPQPDGRLPREAVERLKALGAWLKVNGEAIYETRPLPPYRKGVWAFTRNRRTGAEYAIRLWDVNHKPNSFEVLPGISAKKVIHVGSGAEFSCRKENGGSAFVLPKDFKYDKCADVFKMIK
jgi:alpha-L-fucosidase